jgi:hypothetical protein
MKRSVGLRWPARPQIDLAIATGLSKRAVAERYGVSRDAVWRHAQAHLKQCHHERNQIPGLLRLTPGDSGLSCSKEAR